MADESSPASSLAADDAPFRLDGRTALITGGTRGLGRVIAADFAAAGARVLLTGRRLADAEEAARAVGGMGFAYDAASSDGYARLAEEVGAKAGKLDILVNNAAILAPHFISRVAPEEFDRLFEVNTRSVFFLTKALHPLLKASGRGRVVFLGAAGSHRPMAGIGVYCASKAATRNFAATFAKEWARDGIRVNLLTPGSIATDFILPKDPEKRASFVADMASQNLLGRLAEPIEIARAVRFLASDASSFMTAADMVVDGGFLA